MSSDQARLEVYIDVLGKPEQCALVLPHLTPPALIAAILQEFGTELDYLGNAPPAYCLLKADGTALDDAPLGQQLGDGTRLRLVEQAPALPANVQPLDEPVYLRELVTGAVYRLHWQPALIGRREKEPEAGRGAEKQLPQAWLAVDLAGYKTGQGVSRRQAQITSVDGQYFVQSISQRNPTYIKTAGDDPILVTAEKHPLQSGDLLWLKMSDITLKFLVRQAQPLLVAEGEGHER